MGSAAYKLNQFSPKGYAGIPQPGPEAAGFDTKPYEYVYNPPNGALTALQLINPDTVAIQSDADFFAGGWYLSLFTGSFQIQLIDSTGYQLSDGLINSGAISQSASVPTVLSPTHMFPAGGKIQIVIQDLSGASNPLQIVFKGWKRFKLPNT